MDYIVLDMEWNQPWPGSPSSKKVLPVQIRGEIIQMGAVRLTDRELNGEFQIMVRPKYYRRLNRRVSKLTGIKESRLLAEGVGFTEAVERFRQWCGENVIFLTWGFDDITILRENLQLYGLDTDWTERWYNAQMIFNAQTDGSTSQKALKTAMAYFEIEATRPAHDALGDAYHTALICARLELERGMEEYDKALENHDNGFHGAEVPGCISRHVYYGYPDRKSAMEAMAGEENRCPVCGKPMESQRWFSQRGHRYMDLAECPDHGKFFIRVRLSDQSDGTVRASRLVYESSAQTAQTYSRRADTAEPEGTRKPRRRRRKSVKRSPEEKKTTAET